MGRLILTQSNVLVSSFKSGWPTVLVSSSGRESNHITMLSALNPLDTYSALGELCSGPVTDRMMMRARRRAMAGGKTASPEVRLQGIWTGAITVPVGLLMYVLTNPIICCIEELPLQMQVPQLCRGPYSSIFMLVFLQMV